MKVLIVEDDEATRFFLKKAVSGEGHETRIAADGEEGLRLFWEFAPDLVLTDIMMPRMNGITLLEKIRAVNLDAVVVIFSSQETSEFTVKALRLRANDYLIKPLMERDLISLIKKYEGLISGTKTAGETWKLIRSKDITMELPNRLELVRGAAEYLTSEVKTAVAPNQRLGIYLGLAEIISNGILYGNLEVTAEEKNRALEEGGGAWEKLLDSRLSRAELASRHLTIEFRMTREGCAWTVIDEGRGFDWEALADPTCPENLLKTHGRGITISRFMFDSLNYLGHGNIVKLTKRF